MSSLLFGGINTGPVPADENIVRMTTAPVTPDAPPAMADTAPDFNEVETDPNPLLGLASRQVASTWHEGEQFTPPWIPEVDANHLHNDLIDRQVSSSGTAAAREAAGIFGHGTLKYAEGIEPVGDLRDGGKMGNEYLKVAEPGIQSTAGNYMTVPPGMDQDTTARVAATGKDVARQANVSALYSNYYRGLMGE